MQQKNVLGTNISLSTGISCTATNTTYPIAGQVTDKASGSPIAGYKIHILDSTKGNKTDIVVTNTNGYFCDNTLVGKYEGYAVRPDSLLEYGNNCPAGYLCDVSHLPTPSSYENQVGAAGNKPNCATNCNFQFIPLPTPTTISQTPTATPPSGCYYTYSCLGVANAGCTTKLVCPTNAPSVQAQLGFNNPISPTSSPTPLQSPTPTAVLTSTPTPLSLPHGIPSSQITINADINKNAFTNNMLGQAYVKFDLLGGINTFDQVPGLVSATAQIHPGIIRIGGNWVNQVGWNRNCTDSCNNFNYHSWRTQNSTFTYYYAYYPQLIDAVAQYANQIGAAVILDINVLDSNPSMWADLVRYTNIEHQYHITYWELGNELDYKSGQITASQYANLISPYEQAMYAVDPSIKFVGGVVSTPQELDWNNGNATISNNVSPFFSAASQSTQNAIHQNLDAESMHWYQLCNEPQTLSGWGNLSRWSIESSNFQGLIPTNYWQNENSRRYADIFPGRIRNEAIPTYPGTKLFVDEVNAEGCNNSSVFNGNFLGALHQTDIIGRLAYSGIDGLAMYEGYSGDSFGMIYPDNLNNPTKIYLRPTYYPYLMYAHFFGNQMVQSIVNFPEQLSSWASIDTQTQQLKVMITNFSSQDLTTQITINGFTNPINTIAAFQLTSTNPTDLSAYGLTDNNLSINGIHINAMDIAGSLTEINPINLSNIPISENAFSLTFPKYSVTSLIIGDPTPPNPVVNAFQKLFSPLFNSRSSSGQNRAPSNLPTQNTSPFSLILQANNAIAHGVDSFISSLFRGGK